MPAQLARADVERSDPHSARTLEPDKVMMWQRLDCIFNGARGGVRKLFRVPPLEAE